MEAEFFAGLRIRAVSKQDPHVHGNVKYSGIIINIHIPVDLTADLHISPPLLKPRFRLFARNVDETGIVQRMLTLLDNQRCINDATWKRFDVGPQLNIEHMVMLNMEELWPFFIVYLCMNAISLLVFGGELLTG